MCNSTMFTLTIIYFIYVIPNTAVTEQRINENECAARRCCHFKSHADTDNPINIDCTSFSDRECGTNDEFCEWDCDRNDDDDDDDDSHEGPTYKDKFTRKYRGISLQKGTYTDPDDVEDGNISGAESLSECLSSTKFLATDDCGVLYEEELDAMEQQLFCNKHPAQKLIKDSEINEVTQSQTNELTQSQRRLVVLGLDDRRSVTSTKYPWRATMFITFNKGDGSTWRCTAAMISSRWAITSAHCVYGSGDFYSNFKVYKNIFSCSDLNYDHLFTVNKRLILSEYVDYPTIANDIALLRLDVEPNLGYFGFGYDEKFSGELGFNIISYPIDKADCSKWYQYCPYNEWSTFTMKTAECDTSAGASGSLLYRFISSSRVIFGIHGGGKKSAYNVGPRITAGRYNVICNQISRDDPLRCGIKQVIHNPDTVHQQFKSNPMDKYVNNANLIMLLIPLCFSVISILWYCSFHKQQHNKFNHQQLNQEQDVVDINIKN